MLFSSLTFLYWFLPAVLIAYFIWDNRVYRNTVLLVFSLVFYAWGEPKYVLLMLAASLVAYMGGLLMHHYDNRPKARKTVFIITVSLLTANLFVFKYLNFAVDNINRLFGSSWFVAKIALPIGISFYTFQILSYVIDLYWHKIKLQKNYFYLTLYVALFPQLIAGPIVRYETVEQEICCRHESIDDITTGLRRFVIGLAKKVILANPIGAFAETIYAGNSEIYGTAFYWLAALALALQIYFDFSGYSDMAIGLGRIFGFHFLENFRYPYVSVSITDFWRRWHISLSTWFRDYIYIPLGGNRTKKSRWIFNICCVWALTGFWHGAEWNFLLWGLYYAVLLLIEKLFLHKLLDRLPKFVGWLYAFVLVLIGWVLFNAESLTEIGTILRQMFAFVPTDMIGVIGADSTILYGLIYIPLGIICMFPWCEKIRIKQNMATDIVLNIGALALLVLCIAFIVSSSYNPFIYFRF